MVITISVNLPTDINYPQKGEGKMMIRSKLLILLAVLCALAAATLPIFGILIQRQTRFLQTYGWGDPVMVFGPQPRSSPPKIAASFTKDGRLLLSWESWRYKETDILLGRSTNTTWRITSLGSNITDSNSQPTILTDSDGIVWLAWRGETSTDKERLSKHHINGIFWTISHDGGVSWESPKGLAVYETDISDLGELGETIYSIYSEPQICQLGDAIRIYYNSDKEPDSGWIWYQETRDKGRTWSKPIQIPGSERYDCLWLTKKGELFTIQRRDDRFVSVTVRDSLRQVVVDKTIGYGWPSYVGEDSSGKMWAVWDRNSGEKVKQKYVLENGTTLVSKYVRYDIWLATSTDEGRTWSEPARLSSGKQSETSGLVIEDPNGGYLAAFATYPSLEMAPWKDAWRWSIAIKSATVIQIAEVNTLTR